MKYKDHNICIIRYEHHPIALTRVSIDATGLSIIKLRSNSWTFVLFVEEAQKASVVTGNGVSSNTSFKSIICNISFLAHCILLIPHYMYQKQRQYD